VVDRDQHPGLPVDEAAVQTAAVDDRGDEPVALRFQPCVVELEMHLAPGGDEAVANVQVVGQEAGRQDDLPVVGFEVGVHGLREPLILQVEQAPAPAPAVADHIAEHLRRACRPPQVLILGGNQDLPLVVGEPLEVVVHHDVIEVARAQPTGNDAHHPYQGEEFPHSEYLVAG
jgi:hypothetical protein